MKSNWNACDRAGKVSIGSHSLYLSVSGPQRANSDTPIVIIEAGMSSTSHEFAAVQKMISKFARVCSYDRAGLGYSEKSPVPSTAANRAIELLKLLKATDIQPPYIVVAHSYAGIVAREFLDLVGGGIKGVSGLVLVDTEQERSEIELPFPMSSLGSLLTEEDDYYEIIGLKANLVMPIEDFDFYNDLGKKGDAQATGEEEEQYYLSDCQVLADKKQFERKPLGDGRVSVVKGSTFSDLSKFLAWADVNKREPIEEREKLRDILKSWEQINYDLQREQLNLSNEGRMVDATGPGRTHNLQVTQPDIIARETKWVLRLWP